MTPAPITIRADCSDTELNAAVAEHVAHIQEQWVLMKRGYYYRPKEQGYTDNIEEAGRYTRDETTIHVVFDAEDAVTPHKLPTPPYATDANSVLKLLTAGDGCFKYSSSLGLLTYFKDSYSIHPFYYDGVAPTFCRAACYALLRAHGVTVVE